MAKETMLTFLDTQLNKKMSDYEVAIDWDPKNHTIELVFLLFAQNKEQWQIDDISGVETQEEIIEFEDGILLYNPQKSKFNPEDYLVCLPYEGKKGLPQKALAGLIDYLKEVLEQGTSDLIDFLSDETLETFELIFDEEKYQAVIEKHVDETNYIPYPSY